MSNGTQQPGAPQKKGLPTLAWVGIGCGVIILIVMVVLVAGGLFVANKVKDVAGDFENNPGLASARMMVKLNPDWEEVEVDEDAGTITVLEKSSGKEVTVNFDDLEEGRLSFTTDGEETTITAGQDEDDGGITVTGEDGTTTYSASGDVGELPGWVPIYPGTKPSGGHRMTQGEAFSGAFQLTTSDGPAEIMEYYRKELEQLGFEVSVNTYSSGGQTGGMVNGGDEAGKRGVAVMVAQESGKPTEMSVSYSQD